MLRCSTAQFKNSICVAISTTFSSSCVIHICILDSAISERLSGGSFTVTGVVGGSSNGTLRICAQRSHLLEKYLYCWSWHLHREYSAVRATWLCLWELLLGDQSRAGREILSILQGRPRHTYLAGKSSENSLRIPVPGGYLNTNLPHCLC